MYQKNNYSGTKCPKCSCTDFEIVGDLPKMAAHEMYYLRCSSCKTFLFALPLFDINTQVKNLHEDIVKMKDRFRVL